MLIDDARTPLIISGSSGADEERDFLGQALELAGTFVRDTDYELDEARSQIILTPAGRSASRRRRGGWEPCGAAWCAARGPCTRP